MEPTSAADEDNLISALDKVQQLVPQELLSPKVAIVCGSGLSTLGSAIIDRVDVPYTELSGFLTSGVLGHQNVLAFGWIGTESRRTSVVAMLGRFHAYEGHSLRQVTFPIRFFSRLGCKNIILTNAAGSLNPQIPVGTIVAIHDHLALPDITSLNPLFGPPYTPQTPRFLALSDAYSRTLRKLLFHALYKLNLPQDTLAEGTYTWVTGPTYETAAEGKFLQMAGGDVVGASTVPEVVVAREEGMEVLALSLVTNMVFMPEMMKLRVKDEVEAELRQVPTAAKSVGVVSHDEVLAMGIARAKVVKALVIKVIEAL